MILNKQLLSEMETDARGLESEAPHRAPKLERRIDGQLWATTGEAESPVRVHRCFPWSEPHRYVSLRDDKQRELAFVADPQVWTTVASTTERPSSSHALACASASSLSRIIVCPRFELSFF